MCSAGDKPGACMRWQPRHRRAALLCLLAALSSSACARQDRRIEQHQQAFQSLSSSTRAILSAWLAGVTSGTYTATALEKTLALIEENRTALANNAALLVDPRGARLADAADPLSRLVALLIADVRAANAEAARNHLAALPLDRERR